MDVMVEFEVRSFIEIVNHHDLETSVEKWNNVFVSIIANKITDLFKVDVINIWKEKYCSFMFIKLYDSHDFR